MTTYKIGFIIEQALGHITHTQNLQRNVPRDPDVQAFWGLVPWETRGLAGRIPIYKSNWTVRAGLRARQAVAGIVRQTHLDALFFHTQVPAVLSSNWVRRFPSIVSLDATPIQYDSLGQFYNHQSGSAWLENLKWKLNRDCFQAARRLVAWSEWAKQSLVNDYEVPAEKVIVIPPGVNAADWVCPTPRLPHERPVKILFVGADLERKGGLLLLEAFRALRPIGVELHMVTRASLPEEPGLFVYNQMQPNSAALKQLYYESDIFCLPTYGDCLPMVLSEAGAAGLPVISTRVAGIPEIVEDGTTGFIVPPGDVPALVDALKSLVRNPQLRLVQGERAVDVVTREFDAQRNARRLLSLLKQEVELDPCTAEGGVMASVLLTVSGIVAPDVAEQVARGARPRADYHELANAFDADLIDYAEARRSGGWFGRLLERAGGPDLTLAWACFKRRRNYRAIFTDGEQIGVPLAWFSKFIGAGVRGPRHLMIVHILSVKKKMLFFDRFGVQSHIDRFFVYSTWQKRFIESRWRIAPERVLFTPFMVDTRFFSPEQVTPSTNAMPTICSVGLEARDYPTLLAAVRDLDVHVTIAAASPWSKRADSTQDQAIPENVTVRRFSQFDLRQLYADSRFMVMPLHNVEFQAGVTAILEAMAMGRAVICTRTPGQTDVIVDGETGIYVPPGDSQALAAAINYLLVNPREAARMGQAGRRLVEQSMSLDCYVERLRDVVAEQTRT